MNIHAPDFERGLGNAVLPLAEEEDDAAQFEELPSKRVYKEKTDGSNEHSSRTSPSHAGLPVLPVLPEDTSCSEPAARVWASSPEGRDCSPDIARRRLECAVGDPLLTIPLVHVPLVASACPGQQHLTLPVARYMQHSSVPELPDASAAPGGTEVPELRRPQSSWARPAAFGVEAARNFSSEIMATSASSAREASPAKRTDSRRAAVSPNSYMVLQNAKLRAQPPETGLASRSAFLGKATLTVETSLVSKQFLLDSSEPPPQKPVLRPESLGAGTFSLEDAAVDAPPQAISDWLNSDRAKQFFSNLHGDVGGTPTTSEGPDVSASMVSPIGIHVPQTPMPFWPDHVHGSLPQEDKQVGKAHTASSCQSASARGCGLARAPSASSYAVLQANGLTIKFEGQRKAMVPADRDATLEAGMTVRHVPSESEASISDVLTGDVGGTPSTEVRRTFGGDLPIPRAVAMTSWDNAMPISLVSESSFETRVTSRPIAEPQVQQQLPALAPDHLQDVVASTESELLEHVDLSVPMLPIVPRLPLDKLPKKRMQAPGVLKSSCKDVCQEAAHQVDWFSTKNCCIGEASPGHSVSVRLSETLQQVPPPWIKWSPRVAASSAALAGPAMKGPVAPKAPSGNVLPPRPASSANHEGLVVQTSDGFRFTRSSSNSCASPQSLRPSSASARAPSAPLSGRASFCQTTSVNVLLPQRRLGQWPSAGVPSRASASASRRRAVSEETRPPSPKQQNRSAGREDALSQSAMWVPSQEYAIEAVKEFDTSKKAEVRSPTETQQQKAGAVSVPPLRMPRTGSKQLAARPLERRRPHTTPHRYLRIEKERREEGWHQWEEISLTERCVTGSSFGPFFTTKISPVKPSPMPSGAAAATPSMPMLPMLREKTESPMLEDLVQALEAALKRDEVDVERLSVVAPPPGQVADCAPAQSGDVVDGAAPPNDAAACVAAPSAADKDCWAALRPYFRGCLGDARGGYDQKVIGPLVCFVAVRNFLRRGVQKRGAAGERTAPG